MRTTRSHVGLLMTLLISAGVGLARGAAPAAAPRGATTAPSRGTPPAPARGASRGNPRLPSVPHPAAATDGPTCSFKAAIYEIRVPVDQVGRIEIDALKKAAGTPADFEKALATLGTARPMYVVSQSVRLGGDSIVIGTQTPYITNSQRSNTGNVINSVAFTNVGADFDISGTVVPAGGISVDMSIHVSLMSGGVKIATDVTAPDFHTAIMTHKGLVQPREPIVVMSVDASALDADKTATAYVARVVLGVPQGE